MQVNIGSAFSWLARQTRRVVIVDGRGIAVAQVEAFELELRKRLAMPSCTLKRGDIKNLDMLGMTMAFGVKDKNMLGKLKTGDKVKFKAINEGGKFTVIDIQLVR